MVESGRDWPAIRREYEDGPLTLIEISMRYSVDKKSIYERARREGWRMRSERPRIQKNKGASLLNQLSMAVSQRLAELGAVGAEERTAQDRERDTRLLVALVKLSEKIVDLEKKAREKASGAVEWTQEYRDRTREELAQQLFRMLEQIRGSPLP